MKNTNRQQYKRLIEIIAEHRKHSGMTQQELAKKLDLSQSAISKVESGELALDVLDLMDIADALQIDLRIALEEAGILRRVNDGDIEPLPNKRVDKYALPIGSEPDGDSTNLVLSWNERIR